MKNFNPKIDPNKIFVVDDIAPEWLFNSWRTRVLEAHRWKYGLAATRLDYQKFFALWVAAAGTHRGLRGPFPGDHEGICNTFNDLWQDEIMPKIIPDARVVNIHRVHFNGTLPSNEELGLHYDWDELDMWTMVYYLDGDDGDTVFFDNPQPDENGDLQRPKEIARTAWKLNRAVFFPSYFWHYGQLPSRGFRITLSFNYRLNRCMINEELREDRCINDPLLPHPDLKDFFNELDEKARHEQFKNRSHLPKK
jgi:hypothetical protein